MSLQIIFPNEEKMKPSNLNNLKENINRLLLKNALNQKEIDELNKYLGEVQGYLLVADRKNLKDYFDNFCKLNFLDIFNSFLGKKTERITYSILEMITFLTINIQNQELLEYIFSKKYPTNIIGQNMNIIDKLISLDTKKNEEYLTYQINFIKSLTLKMNINSLNYFYDCNINQFPILTKSLSLYNYSDPLIRNVVKNIFLAIIKIENKNLREFLITFPINLYYSNIIFQLKNTIMALCLIDLGGDGGKKSFGKLQKEHDFIVDTVFYIADLLSLNIEKINFVLINCLLNEILFPLIFVLINDKKDNINVYHSLYLLCLFLFTNKNEFLFNIITYFLFSDKISNKFFFKLASSPFTVINKNLMEIINFLITNNLYADINEPSWQKIKNYMKISNGIDLSTGEIDVKNTYDFSKNSMNDLNDIDAKNNSIFENIKTFFLCNDDALILTLNLIINSSFKFYNTLPDKINDNEKNNQNNINEDDDDGFNLISDNNNEIVEQKTGYDLLSNTFFQISVEKLNDDKSDNIINILFSYLNNQKIFRLATYEIILINIQLLIKTFLTKNKNDEGIKKAFLLKLIKSLDIQFENMEKLLKKDLNLDKYVFSSSIQAYDHYVKNVDKKISDLITLPNILVPLIFLDKIEEIPVQLRESKDRHEFLRNYIFNIFFLNDIIYDLVGDQSKIIKSNKFPFQIETIKFNIGKVYREQELGEDYVHCQILRNNTFIKCQVILSSDTFYLGEVMSGKFEDLSQVKIFKKIPMRYLEIKSGDSNVTLNIIDKSSKVTQNNILKMHCLYENNTKNMYNYLNQQILFCLNLEKSIFDSFMEEMKNRIHKLI